MRLQDYYFRKIQEIGKVGAWELDLQTGDLTWTDEVHRIFGVPVGTPLTLEAFFKCVHPGDREFVNERWDQALKGEPYDVDHRIVADGVVRWVREKAEVEFDETGTAVHVIGFVQDVTRRKESEECLRRSEARFRTFFDESFQFALILDVDGRVLEMNRLCNSVCGPLADGVVGAHFWDAKWWHQFPDAVETTREAVHRAASGDVVSDEVRFLDIDHRQRTGIRTFSPIKDEDGCIVAISVVGLDITDRLRAEEALRSSEKMVSSILKNARAGIGYYSPDGELVLLNDLALEYMGGGYEDHLGKSIADLFGAEAGSEYMRRLRLAAESPETLHFEDFVAFESGQRWFASHYSRILDENDDVQGIMIVSHDITGLKTTQQQLERQTLILEEGQKIGLFGS